MQINAELIFDKDVVTDFDRTVTGPRGGGHGGHSGP